VLLELRELGVEAIDFGGEVGLDPVDLCIELVEAGFEAGDVSSTMNSPAIA
jgi:hypothetical protein